MKIGYVFILLWIQYEKSHTLSDPVSTQTLLKVFKFNIFRYKNWTRLGKSTKHAKNFCWSKFCQHLAERKKLEKREMLEGEMCGFWPALHSTNPTKSAQTRIPAMFVFYILFCQLHFPSFSPQKSPILHHFLRHVSRLSNWGRRVYLPTGELTRRAAPISPQPAQAAALRVGQNARLRQTMS